MKTFKEALDSDICRICGQTPCNCTHVVAEKAKPGLWANIHAKRKRIEQGSGERMRKPGSKGAPTAQAFIDSAKTTKEEVELSEAGAYEKDMDENKPVVAQGVKGMKSKPFEKTFKTMHHFNKWSEDSEKSGDHEVHRVYQKENVNEVSDKTLTDYLEAHYNDKQKPASDPTKRPTFKTKRTELRQHTAMNKLEARPNPHDTQNEEKKKGVDGKACWDGYRYAGTENSKDKCVKVKEDLEHLEELMGTAVRVIHPHELWKASQDSKKKKPITDLETLAKKVKPVKPIKEGEVVKFPKKHESDLDHVKKCVRCGSDTHEGKYMGEKVRVCIPCKQVYLGPNSKIDKHGNLKEGHYEEAQAHMSRANEAHHSKDPGAYYTHMANYHESLSRWHEERGRPNLADRHAKQSEEHHDMGVEQARKLKEGTDAATRLKSNLKKSGFDMDASAARLKAIQDKYKAQNDAIKKRDDEKKVTEQKIEEGMARLISNSIKRVTSITPQQKADIRLGKRKAGNGVNK